jgi:hypothetical protein
VCINSSTQKLAAHSLTTVLNNEVPNAASGLETSKVFLGSSKIKTDNGVNLQIALSNYKV